MILPSVAQSILNEIELYHPGISYFIDAALNVFNYWKKQKRVNIAISLSGMEIHVLTCEWSESNLLNILFSTFILTQNLECFHNLNKFSHKFLVFVNHQVNYWLRHFILFTELLHVFLHLHFFLLLLLFLAQTSFSFFLILLLFGKNFV